MGSCEVGQVRAVWSREVKPQALLLGLAAWTGRCDHGKECQEGDRWSTFGKAAEN